MTPLALMLAASIAFGGIAPLMNDAGTCSHHDYREPAAGDSIVTLVFEGFPSNSTQFWANHFILRVPKLRGDTASFVMLVGERPGSTYDIKRYAQRKGYFYRDGVRYDTVLTSPCPASKRVMVRP